MPTNPTGETGPAEDEYVPDSGPPPTDPSTPKTEVIDHDYEEKVRRLRNAYDTYLGRPATDEDIDGWMSGRFHGGGIDDWLNAIRNSDEAQRHARTGTGTGTGGTTGVPERTGPAPHGWDQAKWADPNHHTTKYDVAAFLYGVTEPSEVKRIVESAAFQERFPGATFDGKDKIDFGDNLEDGVPVGIIDVLMQADEGRNTSAGLWWGDTGNDPAPGPTRAGTTGAGPGSTGAGTTGAGPGQTGAGTTGGWTPDTWAAALLNAQGGSPLFNPPATQGPPSMGYGMGPGGGGGTMGQMITPYNPLATYSPTPYTPPAPFQPPAYQGATPFAQDPYAAAVPFAGPTAEDMAADPSYQFRLQQGQEALERSGAARGVTNTGGTLKDILDYGQQAASQEYGNVYGRQRDVYDMNERNRFNAYQANYGNAMDAYRENERNRAGAFDRNVGTARDAYAMNQANRFQGYQTNELARWQENQEAEARRAGAYGTNLGAYERQQQQGLRAQGQGFDQAFRNWQEQYNQGRMNATDTYNRMFGLGTY